MLKIMMSASNALPQQILRYLEVGCLRFLLDFVFQWTRPANFRLDAFFGASTLSICLLFFSQKVSVISAVWMFDFLPV